MRTSSSCKPFFIVWGPARIQPSSPNPARRPPMLAPLRRQNLNPPPGHANRPAQILSAGRPCWRLAAGKALSHRLATPTGRPKSRLPAVYVGAASLAKPYATVGPRQQAGKSLSHRLTTPTGRPESRLPAAHVGTSPPAKPYPTARPRQQAGPNPARQPSMLAPLRRQSLIPPSGHANSPPRIPPGRRPCWRPSAGKAISHHRTTPTGRPKSRLPAAHVGAPPPAKPYPTA